MTTAVKQKFKEFSYLKTHLSMCKGENPELGHLYNHVSECMSHIVTHCPAEALNKLEEISYLLKCSDTIAIENFLKVNAEHHYAKPSEESLVAATKDKISSSKSHF